MEQVKTGNYKQHDSINILKSKCILHGYGIIEIINNIVKHNMFSENIEKGIYNYSIVKAKEKKIVHCFEHLKAYGISCKICLKNHSSF